MRRLAICLLLCGALAGLNGCELPSWMGGPKKEIKRAPGERIDVITAQPSLKVDEAAKDVPIEIPDQKGTDQWISRNDGMLAAHIGLTGITHHDSATIGKGSAFSQVEAPEPIVVQGLVIAMDAAGAISAHDTARINDIHWMNKSAVEHATDDVLGGGLAFDNDVVFASTGYGSIAIDLKTGKTLWNVKVGAPVRGAPAVGSNIVAVLTADNQTLAYDEATGAPRWNHRGILEAAGYFAATAPVISQDIVIAAYSSGEVFALRAETGNVLWSDSVTSPVRTRASASFSGIDADPIVQDGVVVITSTGGVMQASALLNGRPLWQARIGAHQTPWSAGNALYVLSDTHDLAAVLKRDGSVRWSDSLKNLDSHDKDITPPLFGPILAGNAVLIVGGDGVLHAYRPQDGERLKDYDIASDIVTTPVIAGGAMYLVGKDATLHKYY